MSDDICLACVVNEDAVYRNALMFYLANFAS